MVLKRVWKMAETDRFLDVNRWLELRIVEESQRIAKNLFTKFHKWLKSIDFGCESIIKAKSHWRISKNLFKNLKNGRNQSIFGYNSIIIVKNHWKSPKNPKESILKVWKMAKINQFLDTNRRLKLKIAEESQRIFKNLRH